MASAKLLERDFEPVTIGIRFESQKEMDVFGSMMKNKRICGMLRDLNVFSLIIYNDLEEIGCDTEKYLEATTVSLKKQFESS